MAMFGKSPDDLVKNSLEELIASYHELNSPSVDELTEEPGPLEFMRYVAQNRPVVIRGAAEEWPATQKWDAKYLRGAMTGQTVNVAVTLDGRADAPSVLQTSRGPEMYFVKPLEVEESFEHALKKIQGGSDDNRKSQTDLTVRYMQTQNDNLRNEYSTISSDVPKDIAFARIALQRGPDAVNFWLGNARSTTALHKDNYENIYAQIIGTKRIVLIPPIEAACVNERQLPTASWTAIRCELCESGTPCETTSEPTHGTFGVITTDQPRQTIPFPTWDPEVKLPASVASPFSHLARPMQVTLRQGDLLYLPALWYHSTAQEPDDAKGGIAVSVNYWYDMDFSGHFWSSAAFIRSVGLSACAQQKPSSAIADEAEAETFVVRFGEGPRMPGASGRKS